MKWNVFFFSKIYINLPQFQVIAETKHKEIYKLPNINDKKDKESKIVKKYLRWINL